MDFKLQNGQAQPTQPAQRTVGANGAPTSGGPSRGRKLILSLVIAAVVIFAVIAGVVLMQNKGGGSLTKVDKDKYQAVFLTNGQVYFGRLSDIHSGYVNVKDVYYLQVQQAVQPAAEKPANEQPQVSLTKLGNELHGPTDEMHVSRDQVLFWENLKDDSTVVKAINDYKAKQ